MTSLSPNSNPDSTNLAVPKLRDNRSNWADYSSRIQKAMGLKGLWRHVEGNAVAPKAYTVVDGVPVTSDGKTPKTHLAELKEHFQLMVQRYTNLIAMGSVLSDSHYWTIIMHSLPESYRPALQTITAAERAGAASGTPSSSKMKPNDLMNFFIEEAQH